MKPLALDHSSIRGWMQGLAHNRTVFAIGAASGTDTEVVVRTAAEDDARTARIAELEAECVAGRVLLSAEGLPRTDILHAYAERAAYEQARRGAIAGAIADKGAGR